jgi:hypothetical protein
LLRVKGVIVINDFKYETVNKIYKFLKVNYQNYIELKNAINSDTQVSFVKISEYEKPWFSYKGF